MKNVIFFGEKKPQYYKNLLIRADLNLHEQIFDIFTNKLPQGAKILDLGAGQGALAKRLTDGGFKVVALDSNEQDFKEGSIQYIKINFDNDFEIDDFVKSNESSFDAVACLEVIEHVEDQWKLVRNIRSLLKQDGLALITTPNITNWYSRIYFLRKGTFSQFDQDDLSYGHINPITPFHLNNILKSERFIDIEIKQAGTLPYIWIRKSLGFLIMNLLALFMLPFQKGIMTGWCVVVTARKQN